MLQQLVNEDSACVNHKQEMKKKEEGSSAVI